MNDEDGFVVLNESVGAVAQKPRRKRKRRNYSIGSQTPPTWGKQPDRDPSRDEFERTMALLLAAQQKDSP